MTSKISGMTGFGRADGALHGWNWSIEARSVNGRTLETRYRGPNGFDSLERLAKAASQARFQRGQVTIGVQAKRDNADNVAIQINQDALDRYAALASQLVAQGASAPSADGLLALRGVIEVADQVESEELRAEVEAAMVASIEQAFDALKASRDHEGAQLAPVVSGFVSSIAALVVRAEAEAQAQVEVIRDRFTRRITELAPDAPDLSERIFIEAAALAAKADVREELDRLNAHIESANKLLGQAPAGRKLDFLMQEFMREANTLCSKSATTELTAIGLELKAVIEQLREQVQNVE